MLAGLAAHDALFVKRNQPAFGATELDSRPKASRAGSVRHFDADADYCVTVRVL
jgi:hypothetical protein